MTSAFRYLVFCLLALLSLSTAFAQELLPVNNLQSGVLLVAKPHLGDPRFARSVILLVDYGDRGAWGVVVNKPTRYRLQKLYPQFKGMDGREDRLYWGGPVSPHQQLLLVKDDKPPSELSKALPDGLYLSGSIALLEELVADSASKRLFRVFGGHAGWGPGQLDREFSRGDWFIVPASAALVLESDPRSLWQELMPGRQLKMALAPATSYYR